ncbi:hypothetical protein DFH09DRAFT_1369182, partial [Mycena vulgaris]
MPGCPATAEVCRIQLAGLNRAGKRSHRHRLCTVLRCPCCSPILETSPSLHASCAGGVGRGAALRPRASCHPCASPRLPCSWGSTDILLDAVMVGISGAPDSGTESNAELKRKVPMHPQPQFSLARCRCDDGGG